MSVLALFSRYLVSFCCLLPNLAIAGDWPSFRGPQASGIAKGATPPLTWNGETGENIRWKTAIPGLGHSSPIVVGDLVFVTGAKSDNATPYLRVGLYGESPDHPEDEVFEYKLYCFSKTSGKLLWERTAHQGKPQVKRHIKSSHANPTAASNGKQVLAFFGSEGLYCYSTEGKLLWSKDLGYLNSGAFNAPEIQWGFGNSPIIYKDMAIVLCDVNNQSFITALNLATGEEVWRTNRDENATWCTPTVVEHKGQTQVIVNGFKHIGAYDVQTGAEIWNLKGGGDVPVPTAVVAHDMAYITNAHGRMRPIYAISLDARGDISLQEGQTSNQYVRWSHPRNGAYMPSPLVYGDYLYVANNVGVLTCCNARTGEVVYRARIAGRRGSYSASPVAADGKLYFTDEEGDIHILEAGPKYKYLGTNPIGGLCLATPAIVDDMLIVRSSRHLYGIGDTHGKILVKASEKKEEPVVAAHAPKVPLEALDPTDPISILKHVDAAATKVDLVRYKVKVKGEKAAASRGSMEMTITLQGFQQGLPKYFAANGTLVDPDMDKPVVFSIGSDSLQFYGIIEGEKQLHQELEFGVIGDLIGPLRQGIFAEFYREEPFLDEINAPKVELTGSERLGAEDCWVINVDFAQRPGRLTTWYIAKNDLLPRGRRDAFLNRDGQPAAMFKVITQLDLSPALNSDWYAAPKMQDITPEPIKIP